jgi:predicted nucleic acid-binding protein
LKNKGLEIDFRDLLIGATALNNNLKLVTLNKKHFSRVDNLEIIEMR